LVRLLSRAVLVAHLVFLPLALALGFGLCRHDLGWSDSLVIARSPVLSVPHPSLPEYVRYWYTHLNGRASQGVVASLARWPFSGAASPEAFPFWIYAGLAFGCALLSAVLAGACVARVRRALLPGAVVTGTVLRGRPTPCRSNVIPPPGHLPGLLLPAT
jgi:hypothetical protein